MSALAQLMTAAGVFFVVGTWVVVMVLRDKWARTERDREKEREHRIELRNALTHLRLELDEELRDTQEAMRRVRHESQRVSEELEDQVRARQREQMERRLIEPERLLSLLDLQMVAAALARAYAHPDNSHKVLDPILIAAMTAEIAGVVRRAVEANPAPARGRAEMTPECRALNAAILDQLRAPYGWDPRGAHSLLEEFLRHWAREDDRKGPPETLAYIDGCPLYDRDVELANEWKVDVRLVLGMRYLMVKYEDPARLRLPQRTESVTEGERNLEV